MRRSPLLLAAPVVELRPYRASGEVAAEKQARSGCSFGRRAALSLLQFWPSKTFLLRGTRLEPMLQSILASRCEWILQAGGEATGPGEPVVELIHRLARGPQ
jgi:hypothetical protein